MKDVTEPEKFDDIILDDRQNIWKCGMAGYNHHVKGKASQLLAKLNIWSVNAGVKTRLKKRDYIWLREPQ